MQSRMSQSTSAFRCAPSIALAQYAPKKTFAEGTPAHIGTTAHEIFGSICRGERVNYDALPVDIRIMAFQWRKLWHEGNDEAGIPPISAYFNTDTMKFEREVVDPDTGDEGHVDLCDYNDNFAIVLDWKTGRMDTDDWPQLWRYGRAWGTEVKATKVYMILIKFRAEDIYDAQCMTMDELDELMMDFRRNRHWAFAASNKDLEIRSNYNEGPWCAQCPAHSTCPVQRDYMLAVLQEPERQLDLTHLSGHQLETARAKLSILERFARDGKQAIKDEVRARGSVDIGNGKALTIVEQMNKEWDTPHAMEWMRRKKIPLAECVTVNWSALDKCMSERIRASYPDKMPRGAIGEGKKVYLEELENSGALTYKPQERLKVVSSDKLIESKKENVA